MRDTHTHTDRETKTEHRHMQTHTNTDAYRRTEAGRQDKVKAMQCRVLACTQSRDGESNGNHAHKTQTHFWFDVEVSNPASVDGAHGVDELGKAGHHVCCVQPAVELVSVARSDHVEDVPLLAQVEHHVPNVLQPGRRRAECNVYEEGALSVFWLFWGGGLKRKVHTEREREASGMETAYILF